MSVQRAMASMANNAHAACFGLCVLDILKLRTFSEILEASDDGFSNTCVGHRSFLLLLWLAVTIKIPSNHKKSVKICANDVTVWTPHKWRIGVIRHLFPGCPTQTMQCGNRFWIDLFYYALSFISKTGLSLLNKYTYISVFMLRWSMQ